MVVFSAKYRSEAVEIMDDFNLQGGEMKQLLSDLRWVNKWLGGTEISLQGIGMLLNGIPKEKTITLLDIGCGDGELLRQCARYAQKKGHRFRLIGIDANEHILEEAKIRSKAFPAISFQKIDVLSEAYLLPEFDIALCTLFLHHFKHEEIVQLLQKIMERAKVGMVINDLERSRIAFWLFKVISHLFLKTKTARYDGLVSIASGFTKQEIKNIAQQVNAPSSTVTWKWAFRYQWVIKTNV